MSERGEGGEWCGVASFIVALFVEVFDGLFDGLIDGLFDGLFDRLFVALFDRLLIPSSIDGLSLTPSMNPFG